MTVLSRFMFFPVPSLKNPKVEKATFSAKSTVKSNSAASAELMPSIFWSGVMLLNTLERLSCPGPRLEASSGETKSRVFDPLSLVSKKKTLDAAH